MRIVFVGTCEYWEILILNICARYLGPKWQEREHNSASNDVFAGWQGLVVEYEQHLGNVVDGRGWGWWRCGLGGRRKKERVRDYIQYLSFES